MIKKELAVVRSRGTTPLAKSLEEGAKDFPDNAKYCYINN